MKNVEKLDEIRQIPIPMTIGQLAEVQAEMAEQCASIVEACMETHPSQIGPFYSQGWNKGLRTAAERIRMAYPKPHATNLGEVANENRSDTLKSE